MAAAGPRCPLEARGHGGAGGHFRCTTPNAGRNQQPNGSAIRFPTSVVLIVNEKNATRLISKQRMLKPSGRHMTAAPTGSPEGTQDRNRRPPHPAVRHRSPSPQPQRSPEETQDEKAQDTGQRWLRCTSKE